MVALLRILAPCLLAMPAAAAELPADVSGRFAAAVHPSRSRSFVGTFRVTASTVLSRRDGTPVEQVWLVIRVERSADGTRTAFVERAEQDGEDVTAEMRLRLPAGRPTPAHGDVAIAHPFGADARRYVVSPPIARRGHLEADFRPRSGERGRGLARGTLAWDPATLDPMWARYELLQPTADMREAALRFDYERQGAMVFVTHVWVQGRAGRWIFERLYDMDLKVTDIRPAEGRGLGGGVGPPAPAAAAR